MQKRQEKKIDMNMGLFNNKAVSRNTLADKKVDVMYKEVSSLRAELFFVVLDCDEEDFWSEINIFEYKSRFLIVFFVFWSKSPEQWSGFPAIRSGNQID